MHPLEVSEIRVGRAKLVDSPKRCCCTVSIDGINHNLVTLASDENLTINAIHKDATYAPASLVTR